jgi:hypothetical protein
VPSSLKKLSLLTAIFESLQNALQTTTGLDIDPGILHFSASVVSPRSLKAVKRPESI